MGETISKKTVIASMLYKAMEKIGGKALGFIVSVVLARIIAPEIFGVLAILMAVIAIVQVLVDSGLNVALIQNETTTYDDYSTVFYLSFGIATVVYICLCIATAPLLSFFSISGYEIHFRVLLTVVLFYAYNSIQTAQLARDMRFKDMFLCNTISILVSGIVGIIAAVEGLGVWALVMYYVSNSVTACIAFSFISNWHPKLVFSISRAKAFLGFGVKMLCSSLLTSLFYQLRTFVVGKLYSSAQLAFYSRGDQIPNIVTSTVDSVFKSVLLPVYSRKQDSQEELLKLLRKTIRLNSYLNFPAMCGLSATAFALITIIFTSKWEGSVVFLQILSIANMATSITSPCLVSIQAIGRGDSYFRLEIVRRVIMTLILIGSIFFHSLIAIAFGWLISSVIDVIVIVFVSNRLIRYSFKMLLEDTLPNLVISAIMMIIVYLVGYIPISLGLLLLLQIAIGVVVYVVLSSLLRIDSYVEYKKMLTKAIKF